MNQANSKSSSNQSQGRSVAGNLAGSGGISLPAVSTQFPAQQVVQRVYDGSRSMEDKKVKDLLKDLAEMFEGLNNERSEEYKKFKKMIESGRDYDQMEITNVLLGEATIEEEKEKHNSSDEEEEEDWGEEGEENEDWQEEEQDFDDYQEPVEKEKESSKAELKDEGEKFVIEKPITTDFKAVVLWAGTQLTDFQITAIKNAATGHSDPGVDQGGAEGWSKTVFSKVQFDQDDLINNFHKGNVKESGVQQAVEQESIHAKQINDIVKILGALGAHVQVFRPADNLLIRRENPYIQNNWIPYAGDFSNVQPFIDKSAKTILVTVGHGFPTGRTNFPAQGMLLQSEIQQKLKLRSDGNAVMYIPLQCYPGVAVREGSKIGWHSKSIPSDQVSSDGEMRQWVERQLLKEVYQWLGG
ncbi:hypothetical protein MRBLMN1_003813 [Chitinophaga ginsengisegetis]|uniref:hypothetical protein n=1 Tax=Chitinophaga ginsengisegetis TaxID=393003 RepID=UPI0034378582